MTRTLLGTILAAALVVIAPGVASARSNTHGDPAGDVWTTNVDTSVLDPTATDSDVRQIYMAHRKRMVSTIMTVRSIGTNGGTLPDAFSFKFINGKGLMVVMRVYSNNHILVTRINKKGNSVPYRCKGVKFAVNPVSARAAINFPRKCVGSPKLLRLEAYAYSNDAALAPYADDAYGPFSPTDGAHRVGTSPWLKRG